MSCEKELEQLAGSLMNSRSKWFKGNRHYFKVLQAFIRDGGRCVYCEKTLWNTFDACIASCGDHLLPRSTYPLRAEDVNNLVPACAECNAIKRDCDPSKEEGREIVITDTTEITEEVRRRLICNAQEQIKRKMNSDNWRNEFRIAKPLFDEAVEKYRKCKESPVAA
jgi:hypothetical protein